MKSAVQNVLLLATSLLMAAFLLEAGVLLFLGEQVKLPRHVVGGPFGLRINEPNAIYREKTPDVTVYFRINGQGMRSNRDYAYEKPANLQRIVALGDSFTLGQEVTVEETFSSALETELNKGGFKVEVMNTGVSGYGSAEECLYLERELMKYQPDIVIISFFGNDEVDNVRSNLFGLRGRELIEIEKTYLPLGAFGDFLNRNSILNFLSERSNAFAFLKERVTEVLKRRVVADNLKTLERAKAGYGASGERIRYEESLTAAIFERIYSDTRKSHTPLIIQSIPFHSKNPEQLIEAFPLKEFDVHRDGLYFVSGEKILEPFLGKEELYWDRSDGHWTPFSHAQSAQGLASLIIREKLLADREVDSERE